MEHRLKELQQMANLPNPIKTDTDTISTADMGLTNQTEALADEKTNLTTNITTGQTYSRDEVLDYFGVSDTGILPTINFDAYLQTELYSLANYLDYHQSLADWLTSASANMIDNATKTSCLTQVVTNINCIKSQFDMLSSGLTGFNTIGITSGENDVLGKLDNLLANADNVVAQFDRLSTQADKIVDFITKGVGEIDNFGTYVTDKMNQLGETLSKILNGDFLNPLSNMPTEVMNNIMGLQFVQDVMATPKRVMGIADNMLLTLQTIKSPTNLKGVMAIIKKLKKVVGLAKQAQQIVTNTYNKLKMVYNKMSSGQYFGALLTITGGLRFLQSPSAYNAKYPYNNGYRTKSGHVMEKDDTPGSERVNIAHRTGSGIEMQPDGAMITQAKGGHQLVSEKNIEIRAKGTYQSTIDGPVDIEGSSVVISAKEGTTTIGGTDVFITSDAVTGGVTLNGGDVSVSSKTSTTISAGMEAEIAAVGTVRISSNKSIILDAPTIMIGTPVSTNISIVYGNLKAGIGVAGAAGSTEMFSGKQFVNGSMFSLEGATINSATMIKQVAPLITLN
jgi:hypothetical protein